MLRSNYGSKAATHRQTRAPHRAETQDSPAKPTKRHHAGGHCRNHLTLLPATPMLQSYCRTSLSVCCIRAASKPPAASSRASSSSSSFLAFGLLRRAHSSGCPPSSGECSVHECHPFPSPGSPPSWLWLGLPPQLSSPARHCCAVGSTSTDGQPPDSLLSPPRVRLAPANCGSGAVAVAGAGASVLLVAQPAVEEGSFFWRCEEGRSSARSVRRVGSKYASSMLVF